MGRRLDDAGFVFAVCSWIAANPKPPRFRRREGWDVSAVATRTIAWMRELSQRAATLPREFVARTVASIAEQIGYLERHPEPGLDFPKALILAGKFFVGEEAARWSCLGLERLSAELETQILPDGVHRGRDLAHQLEAFADLLECRAAIERKGLRRDLDATLERMAQAAVDLRHADECGAAAECLRAHAALGGRTFVPRPAFAFPSAALFGLRGESSLLLVDGGELAFSWSVGGLRIVIDARAIPRATPRSTSGTGTPAVIEDFAQREDSLSLVESKGGHRRSLRATTRGLQVEDEGAGVSGEALRTRILLHPEVRAEARRDGRSAVLRRKGVAVLLESESPIRVGREVVIHHGLAPCAGEFSLRSVPELREEPGFDLDARPSLLVERGARTPTTVAEDPILSQTR